MIWTKPAWNEPLDGRTVLLCCLLLVAPLAIALALLVDPQFPLPYFYDFARLFLAGNYHADFFPIGYTAFIALGLKLGGFQGVLLLQALLHVVTTACVGAIMVRLKVRKKFALPALLAAGLHPEALLNVFRIVDTSLGTFFLVGALAGIVWIATGNSWPAVFVTGALGGLSLLVRPNYAPLLLLLPLVVLLHRRRLGAMIVIAATAAIAFAAGSAALTGHIGIAKYGPYNLFAGANPFARAALEKNLNAELSVVPALRNLGVQLADPFFSFYVARSSRWNEIFVRAALNFVRQHPGEFMGLAVLKLRILLAPDNRGASKQLTALRIGLAFVVPTLLLAALALFARRPLPALAIFAGVLLYVLPFMLTSSDPRHRNSLDIAALPFAAWCLSERQRVPAES